MRETEWFEGHTAEEGHRAYKVRVGLLFVLACALFFWLPASWAGPMIKASVQGIEITVYSEDCNLKDVVANLPKRATWVEKGKTFEGCAGATPFGVLLFYFKEDRSVAAVPAEHFAQVTNI